MPKLKLNLTRRWVRARPGSVLILVIALLVLLALIGTAYLSSTQTERYSSVQNSINTEADLLIAGLQVSVNSQIANGLYSTDGTYRKAAQEQPTYSGGAAVYPTALNNGYFPYDSTTIDPTLIATDPTPPDMFLADRIPTLPASTSAPTWSSISWPLFTDSGGNYTFESPFGDSIQLGTALQKQNLVCIPTYISQGSNGVVPGMIFQVPTGKTFAPQGGIQVDSGAQVVNTSTGGHVFPAADADGDGIADAGLFKLPVGQINGVTYYGAIRVVDGNSAINVSSAYKQTQDTAYGSSPSINFGFFRSNTGLAELLSNPGDISNLNTYRFGSATDEATGSPGGGGLPGSFSLNSFKWFTYGDEIENQLTNRPGSPGLTNSGAPFVWLGQSATATLAYKYALANPQLPQSQVEYRLAAELYNNVPTQPWSPSQVNTWYTSNFASLASYAGSGTNTNPLRTLLVGNNPVSNAISTRIQNLSTAGPPVWNLNPGTVYKFGDWVTDGPVGGQRSFQCIQQHNPTLANEPEPSPVGGVAYNQGAIAYWAGAQQAASATPPLPGMPFSSLPVKTSINTATFEQLWLGFAQMMTDTISPDNGGTVPQWQPPMQPVAVTASIGTPQQQMGMFRNTIRSAQTPPPYLLTSSQMLKLRAALAAINTVDLRDGDDDVSSRQIVLSDSAGSPQFDVEVFGTEKQPYISEVFIRTDGTTPNTYVALEICNPYQQAITLNHWQIASMNRTATSMSLGGNGPTTPVPIPNGTIIPAASSTGTPGVLILEDTSGGGAGSQRPGDVGTVITANTTKYSTPVATTAQAVVAVPGMAGAAIYSGQPNEVFLMRPRRADGTLTSSPGLSNDIFNEINIYDLVPADQLDLTSLAMPTGGKTYRYLYRRANDGSLSTNRAWHCVYPGVYDAANASTVGRYFTDTGEGTAAIVTDQNDKELCHLGAPKGSATDPSSYPTVPIELNNTVMAGGNPVNSLGVPPYTFPFGQFARNADMLQITFIGGYRIRAIGTRLANVPPANTIIEMNSVVMDSALANDNSASPYNLANGTVPGAANTIPTPTPNVFNEQIGRFCPVGDVTPGAAADKQMDFGPGFLAGDTTQKKIYWHYHWAKKLFDYFTVHAPSDDYYPNVNPAFAPLVTPIAVANDNSTYANAQTAGHSEDTAGVEGLININTSPMAVIAQLPFTGTTTGAPPGQNATIAQAIVDYRNQYGPFQSIYDLYKVKAFADLNNTPLATAAAGPLQGVFSPYGLPQGTVAPPVTGTVRYDFQERFLLLNNISNLITTRSDTFTCYVLLQGWRNVGTGNPTLVVQRRLSFLADRGSVTPALNQVLNYKVAGD